jgi:transposase
MIRASLTQEQISELKKYRATAQSENAERALMVLLSHDGKSPITIAKDLKRHPHTVRDWLKRYNEHGIDGLQRKFAPGKTPALRLSVAKEVVGVIEKSPEEFGYPVSLWTTNLLAQWLRDHRDIKTSHDTIERALKSCDYTYRRASRKPPRVQSKHEQKLEIKKMVNQIITNINGPAQVLALDESHFSTEPYVVSGWQKKLWPPTGSNSKKARENISIWRIEFGNTKILLEKREQR